jgi:hypothetical protein
METDSTRGFTFWVPPVHRKLGHRRLDLIVRVGHGLVHVLAHGFEHQQHVRFGEARVGEPQLTWCSLSRVR